MAIGAGKYWLNGLPVDGLSSTAGAGKYWFNGLPYDTLAEAAAPSAITATASLAQGSNTVASSAAAFVQGTANGAQGDQTLASAVAVFVSGSSTLSQADQSLASAGIVPGLATGGGVQDDNTVSSSATLPVLASLTASQVSDSVLAEGVLPGANALLATQDSNTVEATGAVLVSGVSATLQVSNGIAAAARVVISGSVTAQQADHTGPLAQGVVVVAPSYGAWVKAKNRNKPVAPQLPPPVEAGEIVIDEAVLRQMEEERLAALVLQKKTEALGRVEDLRAYAPAEKRPTRPVTIDPRRFDVVEAAPEIRTRVISLFREQPKPALVEPVRGSITLRALGPRHLPEPEIRKARTISLRRSPHRTMTGL